MVYIRIHWVISNVHTYSLPGVFILLVKNSFSLINLIYCVIRWLAW